MANNIVQNAIFRTFELLSEPCLDLLINNISFMQGLPRHIVLTRYYRISKAIE